MEVGGWRLEGLTGEAGWRHSVGGNYLGICVKLVSKGYLLTIGRGITALLTGERGISTELGKDGTSAEERMSRVVLVSAAILTEPQIHRSLGPCSSESALGGWRGSLNGAC